MSPANGILDRIGIKTTIGWTERRSTDNAKHGRIVIQGKVVQVFGWALVASSAATALGQPSTEVCRTVGGVEICVRFDNRSYSPTENTDFAFVLTSPPGVILLIGEDEFGSIHQWRVWCLDSSDNPADIGSITSPGAYNYDVKIRRPGGTAGARNVGTASLIPAGDHHSSINIQTTGDVTGDLVVEEDSSAAGGLATIDIGDDLTGEIVVPKVGGLTLGGNFVGNISITTELDGELRIIGGGFPSSVITIASIAPNRSLKFQFPYQLVGQIVLESGLPANTDMQIIGHTTDDTLIDFLGQDLNGELLLLSGGEVAALAATMQEPRAELAPVREEFWADVLTTLGYD